MTTHDFLKQHCGQWQGNYKLWLEPGKEPAESTTRLLLESTANNCYFLVHYDWEFNNRSRAGIFLIGGKGNQAQATWGDSFHMEPLPMQCDGEMKDDVLVLNGSYPAGDEQWGWRTEFSRSGDSFMMRAYNIMPSGQEDIALEAVYQHHHAR